MKLYDRDYCKLTEEEERAWQEVKRREDESAIGPPGALVKPSFYMDYPKAARHALALFPNNYLDFMELRDSATLVPKIEAFERLLNTPGVDERAILNHIRDERSYCIIGSLLKNYTDFGHHAAYLFPEFQLGTTHCVDYLLVGRNSGGHHFVFVELEAPGGKTTRQDGKLGSAVRKGLDQIGEWKTWLEKNYSSLQEVFEKYKQPDQPLPEELSRLDTTRLHYFVVVGRRADFKLSTYRIARELNGHRRLLHYDNVVDSARGVIGALSY